MDMQQKAFVLKTTQHKTEGLEELNTHLRRGWRVVEMTPMGGAGAGGHESEAQVHLGAVVIVERAQAARAEIIEERQEEVEERIDEIVEGDGAGLDVEKDTNGEETS